MRKMGIDHRMATKSAVIARGKFQKRQLMSLYNLLELTVINLLLYLAEVAADRVMPNTDGPRIANVKRIVATIAAVIVIGIEAIKIKTEIVNSVINVIAIATNAAVDHGMKDPAMIDAAEAAIIALIVAIGVPGNVGAAARQCNAMSIASGVAHVTGVDAVAHVNNCAKG